MRITWRLASQAISNAELYLRGKARSEEEYDPAYQHIVNYKGLQADTVYELRVEGFPAQTVRTLKATPQRRFAILGHTHGTERLDKYPDTLLASHLHGYRPDFVVHAGDCVYHATPKQWRTDFFRLFEETLKETPFYIAPGNHDSGWPFVDGYDLRCFRELFPHNYPKAMEPGPSQAYYHVRQGAIDFYFLSYVADMTPKAPQVLWLMEQLKQSDASFRVVVYGGMNDYYDRSAFLNALPKTGVDLIINGDGAPVPGCIDDTWRIPRAIVGALSQEPSPYLAVQTDEHRMALREIKCDGSQGPSFTLHSKKVRESKVAIEKVYENQKGPKGLATFSPALPTQSNQVQGIQVRLNNAEGGRGFCYVAVQPSERMEGFETSGGEGFVSQYYEFSGKDSLLTFDLPDERPLGSGSFGLQQIHVIVLRMPDQPLVQIDSALLF